MIQARREQFQRQQAEGYVKRQGWHIDNGVRFPSCNASGMCLLWTPQSSITLNNPDSELVCVVHIMKGEREREWVRDQISACVPCWSIFNLFVCAQAYKVHTHIAPIAVRLGPLMNGAPRARLIQFMQGVQKLIEQIDSANFTIWVRRILRMQTFTCRLQKVSILNFLIAILATQLLPLGTLGEFSCK